MPRCTFINGWGPGENKIFRRVSGVSKELELINQFTKIFPPPTFSTEDAFFVHFNNYNPATSPDMITAKHMVSGNKTDSYSLLNYFCAL